MSPRDRLDLQRNSIGFLPLLLPLDLLDDVRVEHSRLLREGLTGTVLITVIPTLESRAL
jgi:hypothetical protein